MLIAKVLEKVCIFAQTNHTYMAKLKETPLILKALNIIAYICLFGLIVGILCGIVALMTKNDSAIAILDIALYSGIASLLLFSLYYITKAACIYIEKEESQTS